MRTACVLLLCVLLTSTLAFAQDAPRVEIFGGYQLTHSGSGVSGISGLNLNGWNAALSGYFNRYVGITADVAGTYTSAKLLTLQGGPSLTADSHLYSVMFGPVVRAANPSPFQPFAHALFGVARGSGSLNVPGLTIDGSDTGFALALGGGLDFKVMPLLSVRPVQIDYMQTRLGGDSQNSFRYSAGLVIRF